MRQRAAEGQRCCGKMGKCRALTRHKKYELFILLSFSFWRAPACIKYYFHRRHHHHCRRCAEQMEKSYWCDVFRARVGCIHFFRARSLVSCCPLCLLILVFFSPRSYATACSSYSEDFRSFFSSSVRRYAHHCTVRHRYTIYV